MTKGRAPARGGDLAPAAAAQRLHVALVDGMVTSSPGPRAAVAPQPSPEAAAAKAAAAAFRQYGLWVVPEGALGRDEVERCRAAVDRAAETCRQRRQLLGGRQLGAPLHVAAGTAADFHVHERQPGRFDILLPELAAFGHLREKVLALASDALGAPRSGLAVRAMGAMVAEPGCGGGPWHRDGADLFPEEDPGTAAALPPYACLCFIPLVDVSEANGSTELVPESHRSPDMEPLPSVVMDLPAGSALLFDYRLYHRAIPNRSAEPRPVLYATVARDWFQDAARDWPAGACDRFRLPT